MFVSRDVSEKWQANGWRTSKDTTKGPLKMHHEWSMMDKTLRFLLVII